MRAMVLRAPGEALVEETRPLPDPGPMDLLLKVRACAVCRTDLHVVDGDLKHPHLPIIPGHEIVGEVVGMGTDVTGFAVGDRVGVPWLGGVCGHCFYCRHDLENLCDTPVFTGYQRDGGFATHVVADHRFCFRLPDGYDDVAIAPLLCAGLIGHRALSMAGACDMLGLYGFGAAAHIIAQIARDRGTRVFAFTRPGDTEAQMFARSLGAEWAGGSGEAPPEALDAAIIFAPVGALVPEALAHVRKGGSVVCAGIHMSDIPGFSYDLLWGERRILSVANLTRADARDFLALAGRTKIETRTRTYRLAEANQALDDLRGGRLQGAAVLVP